MPSKDDCFVPCVPPHTLVLTNPSVKQIDQIEEDDFVLTHEGEFRKVTQVYSRHFVGDLVSIKSRYYSDPMLLTPEHEILVKQKGKTELLWMPAIEVRRSDYLAFPINRTEIDQTYISKTMMGLAGYYLAEGDMPPVNRVRFNFGKHETNLIADTVRRLTNEAKRLGIPRGTVVNWIYRGKKPFEKSLHPSYERIAIYSEYFATFFRQFGSRAENKCLPLWAMLMPLEKQAELVRCYWRGDGNIGKDTFDMVTVSRVLAHQLKSLLLRFGIVASITVIPIEAQGKSSIAGREIRAKHTKYLLRIGGKSLEAFATMIGLKHPFVEERSRTYEFCKRFGNYLLYPIAEVSHVPYNGQVRNLAVEHAQSYVLAMMAVHNCDTDTLLNQDVIGTRGDKSAPVKIDTRKLLKRQIIVSAPV